LSPQRPEKGVRPNMLELLMHEAQMLKQQGKKIGQIAEALGKSIIRRQNRRKRCFWKSLYHLAKKQHHQAEK
jgi:hypothetical protein